MPAIDLAIFDLDGTVLDTLEDLGDSVNEMLRGRGFPEHDYQRYRELIGDGMEQLIRRSLPDGCDDSLVADALREYREAYGRNWNRKSRPYAGIVELLGRLAGGGVLLAVLSNKPHAFTVRCVEGLVPGRPFRRAYGERTGISRKPDPGAALAISAELDVDASRTLFVGDSAVDIETGLCAGMIPVGVLWGFRGEAELRAAGAAHIVGRPEEIDAIAGI